MYSWNKFVEGCVDIDYSRYHNKPNLALAKVRKDGIDRKAWYSDFRNKPMLVTMKAYSSMVTMLSLPDREIPLEDVEILRKYNVSFKTKK